MTQARPGGGTGIGLAAWSVHLPGLPPGTRLAGWAPEPAVPTQDAGQLLGRKGMLAKEPATRLALCAVHRALGLPAKTRRVPGSVPDPATAVVASSNLGNAATVAAVAETVQDHGVRAVSPLDAPNVSSNVIASTVAIWFGFGGPNLMVCSGHPSGLDAIALGAVLLAGGRARRVVVVGVEPDDPTAAALLRADPGGLPPLRQAAACVVLEPAGGTTAVLIDPVVDTTGSLLPPDPPDPLLFAPGAGARMPGGPAPGREVVDLTAQLGHTYGALGVLQVAVAAAVLAARGGAARVVCGDAQDGYRTTRLTSKLELK